MILQSLYALYDRLKDDPDYNIAPFGYSLQRITFKIILRPNGELFDIQDARIINGTKLQAQQLRVIGTGKPSGSGFNPCFLWDNTGYMLGFKPDDPKPERTIKTFNSFKQKHLDLEAEIDSPAFSIVCRFLEQWKPSRAIEFPVLKEITSGFGVFQILGQTAYVHEDSIIDKWWKNVCVVDEDPAPMGQCLLTGETVRIARLQPKIKGVSGGKAEAPLVGFNETAYESYGKSQSYNAPVGEVAALRYGSALNALLDGPMKIKHRITMGDATVTFWTDQPTLTEDIFAQFAGYGSTSLTTGDSQDEVVRGKIEIFLKALRQGRAVYTEVAHNPDQTNFYILGLSPNAARISVRFFYRGTVRELLDNLKRHFDDIRVEPQFGEGSKSPDPEFPSLRRLLDETCPLKKGNPDRDKIPPILSGPLLRSVITGALYPQGLYSSVIRRIHADRNIKYCRASIIKGYLTRNMKKEVKMSLDTGSTDHAYRLGRLFAVLEKIQEEGFYQQTKRKLEHSIRDTYFSAACSTPASVFPRLERLSTHHRRHLPIGRKIYFDKLISDIWWELTAPVSVLTIKDQGLFVMGYYHQRKALFQTKQENIQNNEEE